MVGYAKMLHVLTTPYDTIINNIMPTERERDKYNKPEPWMGQHNKEPEIKYTDSPAPSAITKHLSKLRHNTLVEWFMMASICPLCSITRIVLLACFIIALYIILI